MQIKNTQIHKNTSEFLIFTNKAGKDGIEVRIQEETVWLTQKLMAALFDCTTDNIGLHLKTIFIDGELDEESTTEDFSVVQTEGNRDVSRLIKHYNLDAIISVDYDERLKQGQTLFGADYFRELLERVRSIRASERRIWQQITDIFAECSTAHKKKTPDSPAP